MKIRQAYVTRSGCIKHKNQSSRSFTRNLKFTHHGFGTATRLELTATGKIVHDTPTSGSAEMTAKIKARASRRSLYVKKQRVQHGMYETDARYFVKNAQASHNSGGDHHFLPAF